MGTGFYGRSDFTPPGAGLARGNRDPEGPTRFAGFALALPAAGRTAPGSQTPSRRYGGSTREPDNPTARPTRVSRGQPPSGRVFALRAARSGVVDLLDEVGERGGGAPHGSHR